MALVGGQWRQIKLPVVCMRLYAVMSSVVNDWLVLTCLPKPHLSMRVQVHDTTASTA